MATTYVLNTLSDASQAVLGEHQLDHLLSWASFGLSDYEAAALIRNGSTTLYQRARETYDHYLALGDDRVARWPFMASPWPTLAVASAYVLFCRKPPPHLRVGDSLVRPLLVLYNLLNVAANVYIARELFLASSRYSLVCQPVDYSLDADAVRAASALWCYYALKGFELLDSVFFALRGKYSHLSFLHVYHHSTMFVLWWIGARYVAGGSAVFGALANCLVHVLMYSYYALSALGVLRRHLERWKRYLTGLQMAQFAAALVMGANGLRVGCDFPLWMQWANVAYMVSFLVLFGNFYAKSYLSS